MGRGANGAVTQNALKMDKKVNQFVKTKLSKDQREAMMLEQMQRGSRDINKLNLQQLELAINELGDEEESIEDSVQGDPKRVWFPENIGRMPEVDYDFDPDDHNLTCASRIIDKKPMFFDEYDSEHPCFHGITIDTPNTNVVTLNEVLLQYVVDVFSTWEPQKLANLPKVLLDACCETPSFTNICINPLQAMRAWSLLANVAQEKTLQDLLGFVGKYTTGSKYSFTSLDELNKELLNLHVGVEEDFDGCVRLFTELPHHMSHDAELRKKINAIYGGKSGRAALQHHSFATDPDGLYSCYRINEENSLSTNATIRYVVPETKAPFWRSSMAISSSTDCTFYWKTLERPSETRHMKFLDPMTNTFQHCYGIYVKACVMHSEASKVCVFDSWLEGVKLHLMKSNEKPSKLKSFPAALTNTITQSNMLQKRTTNILIPKSTTSSPILLSKHASKNGLSRLFCSEKAQLQRLHEQRKNERANFMTLFDHYHKTNFEIQACEPEETKEREVFDIFEPSKAHQCVDSKQFAKHQRGTENVRSSIFTYYEDHLTQCPDSVSLVKENAKFIVPYKDDIVFDEPFYYIMTRLIGKEPVVVCAGYFNNTIWVKSENEEKKKKEKKVKSEKKK